MTDRQRLTLHLIPAKPMSDAEFMAELKLLLKSALRRHGFRCEHYAVRDGAEPAPAKDAGDGT